VLCFALFEKGAFEGSTTIGHFPEVQILGAAAKNVQFNRVEQQHDGQWSLITDGMKSSP